MTLVDATNTGEVVDILGATEALDLCQRITQQVDKVNVESGVLIDIVADAFVGKAWVSLGYGSWEALCDGMGWEFRPKTSVERAALAKVMRESGMSIRGIGRALGAPKSTVADDLRQLSGSGQLNQPERVAGMDGKDRPATMPETPEPPAPETPENRTSEPSEAPRLCDDCGAELDWRRGDPLPEWFCPECEPPAPLAEVPPASDEVSTSDVVTFLPATWRNYPPLTRTAEGKQLANWLDSKSIKGTDTSEVVAEQAAKCPPDATQKLREHAEVQAAMWQEFADRLTHIRPTLGVVK